MYLLVGVTPRSLQLMGETLQVGWPLGNPFQEPSFALCIPCFSTETRDYVVGGWWGLLAAPRHWYPSAARADQNAPSHEATGTSF